MTALTIFIQNVCLVNPFLGISGPSLTFPKDGDNNSSLRLPLGLLKVQMGRPPKGAGADAQTINVFRKGIFPGISRYLDDQLDLWHVRVVGGAILSLVRLFLRLVLLAGHFSAIIQISRLIQIEITWHFSETQGMSGLLALFRVISICGKHGKTREQNE